MIRIFFILSCLLFSLGFCSPSIPPKPRGWDNWDFNQKVAWRGEKLDPRIPYGLLVDKLRVKEIIKNSVLVAKTLLATDDPKDISIQSLPSSYVMKANNACDRGVLVKDGMIWADTSKMSTSLPLR